MALWHTILFHLSEGNKNVHCKICVKCIKCVNTVQDFINKNVKKRIAELYTLIIQMLLHTNLQNQVCTIIRERLLNGCFQLFIQAQGSKEKHLINKSL